MQCTDTTASDLNNFGLICSPHKLRGGAVTAMLMNSAYSHEYLYPLLSLHSHQWCVGSDTCVKPPAAAAYQDTILLCF